MVAFTALVGWSNSAKAAVITYFNFNDATPSQASLLASDGGARASTITTTFPSFGTPGGITTAAGTTDNAQFGSPAGNALSLPGGTGGANTSNNGKYLQFSVNTTDYYGITVSFVGQSTPGSFNPYTFRYSTDGGATFTDINSTLGPTYTTQNFANLSSIAGLGNNTNAVFQLVFNGATSSAPTNLDNLTVSGTAVPELETWAMMGLGVVALAVFQMRRKRSSQFSPIPQGFAV